MLKEKIYFIAAIGTDIGKTYFVESVVKKLKEKNIAVAAIKPIASGFVASDVNSDTARIRAALGNEKKLDEITPWRFEIAASPHLAALAALNEEINFDDVVKFCQNKIDLARVQGSYLFIEAAGGVMTPINGDKTFLDLACELKIPVILLSANYLGSISHSLTAAAILKSSQLEVETIVVNEYCALKSAPSMLPTQQLCCDLEKFTTIKTVLLDSFLKNFFLAKND